MIRVAEYAAVLGGEAQDHFPGKPRYSSRKPSALAISYLNRHFVICRSVSLGH